MELSYSYNNHHHAGDVVDLDDIPNVNNSSAGAEQVIPNNHQNNVPNGGSSHFSANTNPGYEDQNYVKNEFQPDSFFSYSPTIFNNTKLLDVSSMVFQTDYAADTNIVDNSRQPSDFASWQNIASSDQPSGDRHEVASQNVTCPQCNKVFASPAYLKQHVTRVHVNNKTYQCDLCSMRFHDIFNVKRHRTRSHKEELDFNPALKSKTDFKIRENDNIAETFEPNQNSQSPVSNSNINTDFVHALESSDEPVTKNSVKMHGNSQQNNIDTSARCSTCGNVYSNTSKMIRHYYSIHLNYSPFQCKFCTRAFNQKSHLEEHLANRHSMTKSEAKLHCKDLKFSLKEARKLFPEELYPEASGTPLLKQISHPKPVLKSAQVVSSAIYQRGDQDSNNVPNAEIVHEGPKDVHEGISKDDDDVSNAEIKSENEEEVSSESIEEIPSFESESSYLEKEIKDEMKIESNIDSTQQGSLEVVDQANIAEISSEKPQEKSPMTATSIPPPASKVKNVNVNTNAVPKYSCSICGKTYTQNHNLKTHIRNVHERGLEDDSNSSCESVVKTLENDVHGRGGKKSSENVREEAKNSSASPKKSPDSNTGTTNTSDEPEYYKGIKVKAERSFQCNLCDKKYTQSHNLKLHINKVHEGIKKSSNKRVHNENGSKSKVSKKRAKKVKTKRKNKSYFNESEDDEDDEMGNETDTSFENEYEYENWGNDRPLKQAEIELLIDDPDIIALDNDEDEEDYVQSDQNGLAENHDVEMSKSKLPNKTFNPLEYPKVVFKCRNCIKSSTSSIAIFENSDDMINHHLTCHMSSGNSSEEYYHEQHLQ